MPRGPRLDTPGALHHVMVRGIERRDIFLSDADREDLLARLAVLVPASDCRLYAWSLMPNHFHLLLRSGEAGLSAFMRRLQTGYAVAFNRRQRRSGHLFQNRYKSILVEEEPYFLELVRYIHLNPLRAGLVRSLRELDDFPWSGHAVLLGRRQVEWQDTAAVLDAFGADGASARRAYHRFVADRADQGRRPELSGGGLVRSAGGWGGVVELRRGRERWASDERVLGSSEFVLAVQQQAERSHRDERDGDRCPPEEAGRLLPRLREQVARLFGLTVVELRSGSRRRSAVAARAAFGWVATRVCGLPAAIVSGYLGVSAVSVLRLQERGWRELEARGIDAVQLVRKCK